MLGTIDVLARGYQEPEQKKRIQVKRKCANQKPFVHRAGYHAAVSHYAVGSDGINRFSGTCLNRQIRINEKKRLQDQAAILKAAKDKNKIGFTGVPDPPEKISAWSYPGVARKLRKDQIRITTKNLPAPGRGGVPHYVFSERTRRIVKDKATAFYRSAGKRKVFATLTFIEDPGTDANAISVLNKFLTILRREFSNFQYLWVAERQTKNTNRIHFHLIINTRIGVKRFNGLWVLQQYNAGIVHAKHDITEINARFAAGTMQEIFNPVDLKPIRNIGRLSAYLTKYITKGNNNGGFGCRVWHCSRGVSALITKQIVPAEFMDIVKGYDNAIVDKKTGEILKMPEPYKDKDGRGIFYTVWRINQPGRFLKYLYEMETVNKWIIAAEVSRNQVIEYIQNTILPEDYRKYFLN